MDLPIVLLFAIVLVWARLWPTLQRDGVQRTMVGTVIARHREKLFKDNNAPAKDYQQRAIASSLSSNTPQKGYRRLGSSSFSWSLATSIWTTAPSYMISVNPGYYYPTLKVLHLAWKKS